MDYEVWLIELRAELARWIGGEDEAAAYVEQCGDQCWREMYEDGLSPREASTEEELASHI